MREKFELYAQWLDGDRYLFFHRRANKTLRFSHWDGDDYQGRESILHNNNIKFKLTLIY